MTRTPRGQSRRSLYAFVTLAFAIAMLVPAAAAAGNTPVPHAAFTTTDIAVDGTGHCQNGNESVNCNIYDSKDHVWLNGGPVQGQLDNGTYLFAVLVPGGQGGNENPNDCTTLNLSDLDLPDTTACPTSNTGAGDRWTHRVFSVTDHVMTYPASGYPGGHDFDSTNNKIRLMPYDNTTNPGGVYIMAICLLTDATDLSSTGSNPPGVDPSDCKYDAFKAGASIVPAAAEPSISKDANGSYDNTYKWTINKAVDKTKVVLSSAGTATFNYTITVSHDAGTVGNVKVTGTISVLNPNVDVNNNVLPLDITGVTDKLSNGTDCTVTGGGAQTLTQAVTTFAYSCDLSAVPTGQLDNTATVEWGSQLLDNGAFLASGDKSFTFEGISFTGTDVDTCVDVTDTYAGTLGTVCVGDANPTTYTYSRTVPFDPTQGTNCVSYDNTATFTTNDTGTTGSSGQTVQVCLNPLTIGYWANHLARTGSSGCTGLPSGTGCSSNGPFTGTYLPQSLGSYSVNTILKAAQVFAANNCGNTGKGSTAQQNQNGIACLAAQLLGAELNIANGAANCISGVISKANAFLSGGVADGVTGITYTGPSGNYSSISTAQRNEAITLKSALANYNQGGGC